MKVEVRSRYMINDWESDSTAIISITDPDNDHPPITEKPGLQGVLHLSFHDADVDGFDPEFNFTIMSDDDGDLVADFLEKQKDVDLLIVQCDAGICRSPGMAAAILKHLTGDDSQIFDDNRFVPNRWVYKKTLQALV